MRLALLTLALPVTAAFGADSWSQDTYRKATYTNTLASAGGVTNTVRMLDRVFGTTVGVLTNATTANYVYFQTTLTNFFARTNGMATLAGMTIEGATNAEVYIHLSGAPWTATTLGSAWAVSLADTGVTNSVGGMPIKLTGAVTRGTNYILGASSLGYPVLNLYTNRNLYVVGTAVGSGVTNYPAVGTNYSLRVHYWDDL